MFEKRESRVSFPEMEKKILEFWKKNKIFQKSLDERKDAPVFNFYDGPPFATGMPHYGHILAGAIKDAIPRYKTMKGYYVERRNGWDCHGLPVEYEIEKELNISGKKEIETMGVEAFNNSCRGIVFRYTKEWEKTIERMGRWVDFENSYATMNREYTESIWWVFKQIWDKDLVYQDYRSTWYCPRCGTPLSNFEVNQGYKDNVEDPSIFVKLQLEKDPNTYLLVWTTTPWTLPGNAAVAVHPDLEYVKIKLSASEGSASVRQTKKELTTAEIESVGQYLILAKDRLDVIEQPYEIVKKLKAKDLKGLYYKPLYSFLATDKDAYYVALADFVTAEEGTGLVHVAPAFGEDDFNLGKKLDLPIFRTVNEEGRMSPEVTLWAGTFVKEADEHIIEELVKRSLMYKHGVYKHTYPFCWRCDSPLLNYSLLTWYIKVTEVRDRLVENNQKIRWVPEHIKDGRFGKWLEGARDWNVSRNRYWGAPVPIWECEGCDHKECIGSLEELKEKASYEFVDKIADLDLHRPYIDEVTITCPKCGKPMHRIEEVLDCWFESGSMPYAQAHYPFEDKEKFEQHFPADFIAEGMDQTRGWFYTLHVLATILFDEPAFKNVIVNGIGLDEKGVKLSKRLRNYVEPEVLMDSVGADAMRYFMFAATPMGEDWRFSDDLVKEKMRKVLMTLWNSYVFFITYANIDGWASDASGQMPHLRQGSGGQTDASNLLDKWILSRLQSLVKEMTTAFEDYDLTRTARPIEGFINELSTWYIRRSRRRFWKSESDEDKQDAYSTLYNVLVTLAKLIAPIMPFVADEIYLNLVKSEKLKVQSKDPDSVHLCLYPEVEDSLIDEELEQRMLLVQQVVETARAIRSIEGLKVRQPLSTLYLATEDPGSVKLEDELIDIVKEEINIKEVEIVKEMPKEAKTKEMNGVLVGLDTLLTAELRKEGMIRDLVREIQSARKKAGFNIEDRIETTLEFDSQDLAEALKAWNEYVCKETLSETLETGKVGDKVDFAGEVTVHEVSVKLGLKKK